MGRYLANGVVTKFKISKKVYYYGYYDNGFNLKEEINDILKDMNKVIDTSMYELKEEQEDYFEFVLKPKIFDENIYALLKEISDLTYPNFNDIFSDENIDFKNDNEDFIKNHPFRSKIDDDFITIFNDEELFIESPFFYSDWLLDNKRYQKNTKIDIYVLDLWMEFNKYAGENEYFMLKIINNMKTKYYNTKLSKAFVYYIKG